MLVKVYDHEKYNPEFPELFNWDMNDSFKITDIANNIIEEIKKDLRTGDRNYVGGLRKALNIIANQAIINVY